MTKEEIKAWRIIVEILRTTGYYSMYEKEISIVANCLKKGKEQNEKEKQERYISKI